MGSEMCIRDRSMRISLGAATLLWLLFSDSDAQQSLLQHFLVAITTCAPAMSPKVPRRGNRGEGDLTQRYYPVKPATVPSVAARTVPTARQLCMTPTSPPQTKPIVLLLLLLQVGDRLIFHWSRLTRVWDHPLEIVKETATVMKTAKKG